MKRDLPEPADRTTALREQLVLAQVRIMELEDAREELAERLAATDELLAAAQRLADEKISETAHLTSVQRQLASRGTELQGEIERLARELDETRGRLASVTSDVAAAHTAAADAEQRAATLRAELAGIRNSRRWRWSAWLRWLDRSSPDQ